MPFQISNCHTQEPPAKILRLALSSKLAVWYMKCSLDSGCRCDLTVTLSKCITVLLWNLWRDLSSCYDSLWSEICFRKCYQTVVCEAARQSSTGWHAHTHSLTHSLTHVHAHAQWNLICSQSSLPDLTQKCAAFWISDCFVDEDFYFVTNFRMMPAR